MEPVVSLAVIYAPVPGSDGLEGELGRGLALPRVRPAPSCSRGGRP